MQERVDFVVEAIAAMGPRNELEAMLAAQMAATHLAAMRQLERLGRAETACHSSKRANARPIG